MALFGFLGLLIYGIGFSTTDKAKKKGRLEVAKKGGATHTFFLDSDDEMPQLSPRASGAEPEGGSSTDDTVVYLVDDHCKKKGVPTPTKKKVRAPNGKANPSNWDRNVHKDLRHEGKAYLGTVSQGKGQPKKKVPKSGKKMGPPCIRHAQCMKITEQERMDIHDDFWLEERSWLDRHHYLKALTHNISKNARLRVTNEWTLKTMSGRVHTVCRPLVESTFGMSGRTLSRWLGRQAVHGPKNTKAAKTGKTRPFSEAEKEYLNSFLDGVPTVPSHYCRSFYKDAKFLEANVTVARLHRIYLQLCKRDSIRGCSRATFHAVLKKKKIRIHRPRKDQCEVCISGRTNQKTKAEMERHRQAYKRAQQERRQDEAKASPEKVVWTMDFQAQQKCPRTKASPMYYKSKLSLYNMTYFNKKTKAGHCFIWPEHQGGVDSQAFGHVHRTHFEKILMATTIDTLTVWSDNCGAQNKSCGVSSAFLDLAMDTGTVIEQKWLVPGHSWMEVDAMHAAIERRTRHKDIQVPRDFVLACRAARVRPQSYEVNVLNRDMFMKPNGKALTSIRPGANKKGDLKVQDLCALKYTPHGAVYYKIDFDSKWRKLPQRVDYDLKTYQPLYPPGGKETKELFLSKRKYNDLQDLKNVIEKRYHKYYESLPWSSEKKDDD